MLLTINKDLHVVAECWNRGNQAWGHIAKAYYKGQLVDERKIRYYNRTWEPWQFHDVIWGVIHRLDCFKSIPLSDRIQLARKIKNI